MQQNALLLKSISVKKLVTAAVLLLALHCSAQKSVDLDRYRFSVQLRSLPTVRIDSTYRTYDVDVTTTKLMDQFFMQSDPGKTIRLEGWKKLPSRGHISIQVKLGDLLPGDATVRERVITQRTGNGVITSTKTMYYQEVTYTFEASAVITDYLGMHLGDEQLASRSYKRIYRSPEFSNRLIAEGYFLVNSVAVTRELFRQESTSAIHALNRRINDLYGFETVQTDDFMWSIDSRKHPEYDEWRKALRITTDVLFSMNANTPIDGAREKLAPAIAYFEKIKTDYNSEKRHDRKLRYGAYFNLAVIYYYLDDPQAMMREANGLALNDFDTNDAKGFKQTATWLRNIFEQNNIYTRHFQIDTEAYAGPGE